MDSFTDSELDAILVMCGHERIMLDVARTIVQGIKTASAHAVIAGIAAKAEAMIEAGKRAKAVDAESAKMVQ